jgi:(R,R)-butanediol dehydrogenase / meso-butanediol dehydrogenase / diacetyl reductase
VPTADRGDLSRALGRFAQLISHRVPLLQSERAFDLVLPPGAAEKVIVTLDD